MGNDAPEPGVHYWLTGEAGAALLVAMILGALLLVHVLAPLALARAMPPAEVRRAYRAIVPALNRAAAVLLVLAAALSWDRPDTVWLGVAAILFLYADYVVRPAMQQARDEWDAGDAGAEMPFRRLHRRLFGISFMCVVVLLLVFLRLAADAGRTPS